MKLRNVGKCSGNSSKDTKLKNRLFSDLRFLINRAFVISENKKSSDEQYEKQKAEISEKIAGIMSELGINEVDVRPNGTVCQTEAAVDYITCKLVKPKSIVYDAEALKKKDRELYNEVVNKQVIVNDLPGLVELLKSHGIRFSDFKRFAEITETVNVKSLEMLFQTGWIDLGDIEGCYRLIDRKPYFRISGKRALSDSQLDRLREAESQDKSEKSDCD